MSSDAFRPAIWHHSLPCCFGSARSIKQYLAGSGYRAVAHYRARRERRHQFRHLRGNHGHGNSTTLSLVYCVAAHCIGCFSVGVGAAALNPLW
jgi:hypothetical protein